jgi:hypothetical protein
MSIESTMGRLFAIAPSEEQAELINAAGKMMRQSYPDQHHIDMQMCYISDKLSEDGKMWLRKLVEFVDMPK